MALKNNTLDRIKRLNANIVLWGQLYDSGKMEKDYYEQVIAMANKQLIELNAAYYNHVRTIVGLRR